MDDSAKFINHIVVNLLDKNICSLKNYSLGGSKNTLRQCVKRNKGIGPKVIRMISNLIIQEIDKNKKNKVLEYLKKFLNDTELLYMRRNPADIQTIVKFAVKNLSNNNAVTNESSPEFKMIDIDGLINNGWTIEKIVEEGYKLDFETIDNITIEHNGDFEQWLAIARSNADTIRYLLKNDDEMIGYWHFTPLRDDVYIKAKTGQLLDSEITCDKIPLLLPGTYNIYFISICLKEKYRRKTTTFGKLLFSIIDVIQSLAKKNIFINEICALAYTMNGIQLCQSMGLKYLRDHSEHGQIFCGKIMNLLNKDFCRDFEELKNIYNNKFGGVS